MQELLATSNLLFFNRYFDFIGSKEQLINLVQRASGIDAYSLFRNHLWKPCVAEIMSWVAHRTTKRAEDLAYCMLGLFEVNMPLLYGEGGEKAFIRLQLEIVRKSDDETIFAHSPGGFEKFRELLAASPSFFKPLADHTPGCIGVMTEVSLHHRQPYSMTNQGLEIVLDIPDTASFEAALTQRNKAALVLVALNCVHSLNRTTSRVGIVI